MATRAMALVAALVSALPGCEVLDPLDGYAGGNAAADASTGAPDAGNDAVPGCGTDTKSCAGACVPTTDPTYGCTAPACDPCAFANAVATGCSPAGACVLGPCLTGYADCDGDPANGCESSLGDDASNCDACGHVCALANASSRCAAGACAIAACNPGFGDCDADPSDGCEIATTSDVNHCGSCTTPCPTLASTTFACVASACTIATCVANALACNTDPTDGCECTVPNATVACAPPSAAAGPDGGPDAGDDAASTPLDASTAIPGCYFGQCLPPFVDCDQDRTNGCETDVTTDPASCGSCGFSCGPGGTCVAGRCQPVQLIGSQGNPGQLAIDRDYAYWTNYGAGTIYGSVYSVRKDGANPTPIAGGSDQSQDGAWGVATSYDSGSVYWTTYETSSQVGGSSKVGGGASTLQSTTGHLRGAVLDGNTLYYANYEENTIVSFDVTASSIVPVIVAQAPTIQRPNTIVVDGTSIYVTNEGAPTLSGTSPGSTAKTGTLVAITKASIGGTLVVTTLATTLDRPRGLGVDDTSLYWTNAGSSANVGSVQSVPKAGGTPVTLASGLDSPRELSLCSTSPSTPGDCADDAYVYVTEYGSGNVDRVLKNGSVPVAPFVIASGQKGPIGIAVDGQYVFWANYGTSGVAGGTIMRLAKQP